MLRGFRSSSPVPTHGLVSGGNWRNQALAFHCSNGLREPTPANVADSQHGASRFAVNVFSRPWRKSRRVRDRTDLRFCAMSDIRQMIAHQPFHRPLIGLVQTKVEVPTRPRSVRLVTEWSTVRPLRDMCSNSAIVKHLAVTPRCRCAIRTGSSRQVRRARICAKIADALESLLVEPYRL